MKPDFSGHQGDALLQRVAQAALGVFATATVQGAFCLSSGGVVALAGVLMNAGVSGTPVLFFLGMAIPLGPLRVYFSPERVYERKLALYEKWRRKKLIEKKTHEELKSILLLWYQSHNAPIKHVPKEEGLAEQDALEGVGPRKAGGRRRRE